MRPTPDLMRLKLTHAFLGHVGRPQQVGFAKSSWMNFQVRGCGLPLICPAVCHPGGNGAEGLSSGSSAALSSREALICNRDVGRHNAVIFTMFLQVSARFVICASRLNWAGVIPESTFSSKDLTLDKLFMWPGLFIQIDG